MCESHQVPWIHVQLIEKFPTLILIQQVQIFLYSDFLLQDRNRILGGQLSIKTEAKKALQSFLNPFSPELFPHSAASLYFPGSSLCCWYPCRSFWFCPARPCQTNLQMGFGLFHICVAGCFLYILTKSPGNACVSCILPFNVWVLSEASY